MEMQNKWTAEVNSKTWDGKQKKYTILLNQSDPRESINNVYKLPST